MKLSATLLVSALVASTQAREFVIGRDSLQIDSEKPFALEKRQHKFLDRDAFTVDNDEFSLGKVKRAPKPHKCGGNRRHRNQPTQKHHDDTSLSDQLLAYFKSLLPFSSFTSDTTSAAPANPEDQQILMAESNNSPGLLQSSLTQLPEIYTFTGYIRDSQALTSRFNSQDKFSIVFAPTDEALSKLGQKPWEFPTPIPADDNSPDSEERDERIIKDNLHTFVSSHVSFAEAPLTVGNHVTTTNGVVVTLAERDEGRLSLLAIDKHGKTLVADIIKVQTVKNGQVFIIDSSLIKP
ncbi:hypothetical protein DV495_004068 [Geotrichum candidum]|uniref:FAS1 domain-containing protein n=1 Tax=Geotrichum candidum TaxID=1173061 RepID=A0A0J9X6L6_GEOCN|nr:hypothetical protein DV452_001167 [Geotrichum candidum]KAI9214941.1 hypothetical protein DS838_000107 [Geotrichum bryndzae]KAF5123082.1 hypothetical protein DV495_004068 [Geotrichum candidum]KAF7500487.1 hypothetical protein DV113_001480 [Geotrichum candidum]KAI8132322.1 hypothetical protein DUD61_004015 [Geotrichum candidum]